MTPASVEDLTIRLKDSQLSLQFSDQQQKPTMYRATPLQTNSFGLGDSINVILDDTDASQEKGCTTASRRDSNGDKRDCFVGSRDTASGKQHALAADYYWQHHPSTRTFELAIVDDDRLAKKAGLLRLGRTPSGCDYAQDCLEDDDMTLLTEASSYCPTTSRMQMIHRPIPSLFQDEERDAVDGVHPADDQNDGPVSSSKRSDAEWPHMIPKTERSLPEQQSLVTLLAKSQGVNLIPVKSFGLVDKQEWLEMEPDNSTEDACFCGGYSLLDFWMLDSSLTTRRQRRASMRHLPLNTVEEEEGGNDASFNFCLPMEAPLAPRTKTKPASSTSSTPSTPSTSSTPSTPKKAPVGDYQKKDPVGDYHDPAEMYSCAI
jgi:hypothetical protein